MDVANNPELFQSRKYKILHLADALRKLVHVSGLTMKIDVVITSPLLRTLQTAAAVFGGGSYNDESGDPPLMVAGAGKSNRDAISSQNCPRFIAVELCRERMGVHPCDKRRSVKESKTLFPAVDFSQIASDEDNLWKKDYRESPEEIAARGMKFLNWLWARKEREIAIVTHSSFLYFTLKAFCEDGQPLSKHKLSKSFNNCELRSLILVERRSSRPASSLTEKDCRKFDLKDYDHVMA